MVDLWPAYVSLPLLVIIPAGWILTSSPVVRDRSLNIIKFLREKIMVNPKYEKGYEIIVCGLTEIFGSSLQKG